MHDKILGRTDDMIIFRAVNIYPGQIDEVLSSIPEISCEYQVLLDRKTDGKDYMTIRVECQQDVDPSQSEELSRKIAKKIKSQIMVSCDVDLVDYCGLPRTERKSKRIFDNRQD
jgi:phenylacetate-CoA ligase